MNNLRYYVWKCDSKSFKIDSLFYKSFGSYRNIFRQAPRIHFNGFYVCRHKYVKIGEKGFTHSVTPMHVIFYYRYIRFFEDGSLLCYVIFLSFRFHLQKQTNKCCRNFYRLRMLKTLT